MYVDFFRITGLSRNNKVIPKRGASFKTMVNSKEVEDCENQTREKGQGISEKGLMKGRALESPTVSEFEILEGRCRIGEKMEIPSHLQRDDQDEFCEKLTAWQGYLTNGR
jgi:hypothetical protein